MIWGIHRVITPEQLGLGRHDKIELVRDPYFANNYIVRVLAEGSKHNLTYILDRLSWEIADMAKQARRESDLASH